MKKTLSTVMKYIKKKAGFVILSIVFALVSSLLALLVPIFFGEAIDLVIAEGTDIGAVAIKLLQAALIALVTALMQWFMALINNKVTYEIVEEIRNEAFEKIHDNTGLILHSDQGWQYQMKRYQARLKEKGIIQSMSRKGNCLDNSVMENFFGLLKTEMFYKHHFDSAEHLIDEIEKYIDYYNNKRIKCKLKGLSPVQYRIQSSLVA